MKRIMMVLLMILLFNLMALPICAAAPTEATELLMEQEIENIFGEINNMTLAQQVYKNNVARGDVSVMVEASAENRRAELDARLEELGVHKLDPDCEADMEQFAAIVGEAEATKSSERSQSGIDYSLVARNFSVYEYKNLYEIDGTTFECCTYRVIDDKGDGRLTAVQNDNVLIGNETYVVRDLLDYTFSFGFSQFLGAIPYGWAVDWSLGAIFTGLESYQNSTVTAGNGADGLYSMNMVSVTQMNYYYLYREDIGGMWVTAGSNAPLIDFARTDVFSGNINGKAVSFPKDPENKTSSTGMANWRDYYESLVLDGMEIHSSIGSFTIEALDEGYSTKFKPAYYNMLRRLA